MNKKKIIVIAASLLLLGSIAVKPALAYFTDSHTAKGAVSVTLGEYKIVPDEEVDGLTKTIYVKNTGDFPVYARVKVFVGSTHGLKFEEDKSDDWRYVSSDEFYYYDKILQPTDTSKPLVVTIDPKNETSETFNVIVVEEATLVDSDGNYNWDKKVTYRQETQAVVEPTPTPAPAANEGGEGNEN